MFRHYLLVVFFLFQFCCLSPIEAQSTTDSRTWKSNKGHKIEAVLIDVGDDTVQLKKSNGKSISVEVSKLSKVDQKFLADLKKSKSNSQPTGARELAAGELGKPEVTEEDIQLMGEITELSGGATLRNPFIGSYQKSSSSNTWNGNQASVFQIVNKRKQIELITGFAFENGPKRNYRQVILKQLNVSLDDPKFHKAAKNITFKNKFSTKKPIPDWLGIEGTLTTLSGDDGYLRLYVFFGERTHLLWAFSEDQQQVELMSKTFATLREKGDEEEANKIDDGNSKGSQEEFRTWKDATGKFHIDAVLVEHTDGIVSLKTRSGKEIQMAAEKLSQQDQDYLAK